MSREWEQGAAKLRTVIWLLVVAAAVYVGAKVVPAYIANSALEDKMYEEARYAQANRLSEEQLRDIVFREAQSLDLPVRRDEIHVEMGPRGTYINTSYTATVDLQIYQFKLYFAPTSKHP